LLVQLAWALDATAAAVVTRVEQDEPIGSLLHRAGAGCGRGATEEQDGTAKTTTWITRARTCRASAIETFASSLDGDGATVSAALTEPRSSGQAEGQIIRLKLIKRQSYGRAGPDLLKRRLILAA
jgi:hypothetical protein